MIFHITEQSAWATAQHKGVYRANSLITEGFIHLSTAAQVVATANRFYRGQSDLVLLGIDESLLQAELRYDKVPNHGIFPHLYGELNLAAVQQTWNFGAQADGSFVMPSSNAF